MMKGLVLIALGVCLAHAKEQTIAGNIISMTVEEGNEMEELQGNLLSLTVLDKMKLSDVAKQALLQTDTAVTAMKAYQMSGALSFGNPLPKDGKARPKTVWIQSFGRSGSSSIFELILQAQQDEKEGLFSIFEPCANKDKFHGETIDHNTSTVQHKCVEFMDDLQKCDFENIDELVHWDHKNSNHEAKNFGKLTAEYECEKSGLRVFKTLNTRNLRVDAKMQQAKHPDTKIVHIVRDPRAIWASQKKAEQDGVFKGVWEPEDLCESMMWNSEADNKKTVVTIKFEDLVKRPQTTARALYADLGLDFGEKQRKWVAENFGKHDNCEENALSTCKHNSLASLNKWKQVLDKETAHKFSSGSCKRVFERYGYQWDTERAVERVLKVKRQSQTV